MQWRMLESVETAAEVHGFAVSKLRELIGRDPGIDVDLRYVGNQNSLVSLAHGGCELAGVHLPQGELRSKAIAAARPWVNASEHRAIGFVTREMGIMVKRGNPLRITSLEKLMTPGVRFVNRDPDSGTRRLFDQLLEQQGLDATRLDGYERIEFTHAAVAAYVASGSRFSRIHPCSECWKSCAARSFASPSPRFQVSRRTTRGV
jgi:molybdate-binding protein